MKCSEDGGRTALAVLFFVALLVCAAAPARAWQSTASEDREEVFEKVDPYTRGDAKALEKLGYVQYGPFVLFDKVRTEEVEEALGKVQLLWLETAHFKIGSNLRLYRQVGDVKEDDKLEAELKRLKTRLPYFARLPKNKLDPWVRLHLFAQRLEDQYADFQRRFGLTDGPLDAAPGKEGFRPGEGPLLGMQQKFVVLLTEKKSGSARFLKQFLNTETDHWQRWRTKDGAALLAISSEGLKDLNFTRESDLHATVASEMAMNFVECLGRGGVHPPQWFRAGLAHVYSRQVDERCSVSAVGTSSARDDEHSYNWPPRVYGLVFNKVAKPWPEMALQTKWEDLKAQGHLTAWSRVSWLLARKDTDLNALILGLTAPLGPGGDAERQEAALKAATGRTTAEIDAEWRKFVLREYPKN